MIQKKYIKSRNVYKITFKILASELPEEIEVTAVSVIGSFNDWNPNAHPMKLTKKGTFQTNVELEPEQAYEFRYVANGKHFFNDWNAEGYVANGFGEDNCVVVAKDDAE